MTFSCRLVFTGIRRNYIRDHKSSVTYMYIYNALSLNNSILLEFIDLILSCELKIKDTTEFNTSVLC